jgi:ammonia channel protein AmtB
MEGVAIDTVWVVVAGCLVLFMQAGFAMLEVGLSRMKNAGAVMAKVLVNMCLAFAVFWAIGFAIAFGDGGDFLGRRGGSSSSATPTGWRRSRTRRWTRTRSGSSRPPSPP